MSGVTIGIWSYIDWREDMGRYEQEQYTGSAFTVCGANEENSGSGRQEEGRDLQEAETWAVMSAFV